MTWEEALDLITEQDIEDYENEKGYYNGESTSYFPQGLEMQELRQILSVKEN